MSSWSVRRINRISKIIQARNYLEIGVWRGETFSSIDVENKDAVDPGFQFDYKNDTNQHNRYFEMKSDDFFSKGLHRQNYDVIFLDGLHVFQQTLRDFLNAMQLIGDNGVIVIDDTIPSDIYSAESNQSRSARLRKAANSESTAWHGDVFKLVFFIHDMMQSLSYATIDQGGNAQTVVWRSQRPDFSPRYQSIEAIDRLTFGEMYDNFDCFKCCGEDDLFSNISRHAR